MASKTGYRASDKGFLNMSLEEYFELLVFTGTQGRSNNMRDDAVSHSLSFQPGQKMARECFANAR
ncbi:MAG: hypothetical protein ACK5N9_24515 [Pirellula sp.]